jgi:hypothetical protein
MIICKTMMEVQFKSLGAQNVKAKLNLQFTLKKTSDALLSHYL